MREFHDRYVGPASYEPTHILTEARADIGIKKLREDVNTKEEPVDKRMILYPNLDIVKNNKMGVPFPKQPGFEDQKNSLEFKWKLPTELTHVRDEDIANIHWRYYDVNLDAVREEIAKDVNFGVKRETKDEFKDREEFNHLLEEHMRRRDWAPDMGKYDPVNPNFQIQDHVGWDRMVGRDDEEIDKDADKEGDILILDPSKIGKRIPGFDIEKQIGRPEAPDRDEALDDELILEPNIDVIRPRRPGAPDFDKQIGREEKKTLDDDEVFVVDFDGVAPVPNDPSAPRIRGFHEFGKAEDRFKPSGDDHGLDYL